MNIHLINGFLGSGKTTSIIAASKYLMSQGKSVAVITNDQGRYLVDTAFFRSQDIPAMEVTGGCFCRHYEKLDKHLDEIIDIHKPEIIFAEAVGSSIDLVRSVAEPLQRLRGVSPQSITHTVFVDSRLLWLRLIGGELPFSEEVLYIFDKQIEVAGLLVVNKTDLLSSEKLAQIKEQLAGRSYVLQNALSENGVLSWLKALEGKSDKLMRISPHVDAGQYRKALSALTWLEETIELQTQLGREKAVTAALIRSIFNAICRRGGRVAHLKFLVKSGGVEEKISFQYLEETGWEDRIPKGAECRVTLLVNARVELQAVELRAAMKDALSNCSAKWSELNISLFPPGSPLPLNLQ